MAMNMQVTTKVSDEMLLVSRYDKAIDWRNSFADLLTLEEKIEAYEEDYDHAKLVYVEGLAPTFFVFHNPKLTVLQSRIRSVLTGIQIGLKTNKVQDAEVLMFHVLGIGWRDGGTTTEYQRNKDKDITTDNLQALEDNGALRELGPLILNRAYKAVNIVQFHDAQKK